MADPTHINCLSCNYNLVGIDLAGLCPECGNRILEKCFWCDYDLTNTAPEANCPECGVPAIGSIGDGILATAPDAILTTIYKGLRLATALIPISILWIIVVGFIIARYLINLDSTIFDFWLALLLLVSKLLILAMIFGWWKLASPIPGLPKSIAGSPQRKFLSITLIVFASIIAISIPISFIPTNPDPAAPSELIGYLKIGIGLAGLLSLIVFYFAQLWYMQWFTKLIKNQMMHKRAKYMIWLGPLIMVVGSMILFIGPIIVLVLYWDMLEHLRKDLKAIRKHKTALN